MHKRISFFALCLLAIILACKTDKSPIAIDEDGPEDEEIPVIVYGDTAVGE